jgi:hypothetical protein
VPDESSAKPGLHIRPDNTVPACHWAIYDGEELGGRYETLSEAERWLAHFQAERAAGRPVNWWDDGSVTIGGHDLGDILADLARAREDEARARAAEARAREDEARARTELTEALTKIAQTQAELSRTQAELAEIQKNRDPTVTGGKRATPKPGWTWLGDPVAANLQKLAAEAGEELGPSTLAAKVKQRLERILGKLPPEERPHIPEERAMYEYFKK